MLSTRCPAPLDAAGILGDDPVATLFRPGKVGRVQKQIFETGSQTQLALIKHGQNTDEQKRFPSPACVDGAASARRRPVAARHPSWERWRLAGEFRFLAPDWPALWNNGCNSTGPARRRRSQEVHVKGQPQVSSAVELFLLCRRTAEKQSQTVHHHDDGAAFVTDHADRQWNFAQHRKRHQHNDRAE